MKAFRSVRSRAGRAARLFVPSALALGASVAASAQTSTLPTPTVSDYTAAGTGFVSALSPIVTGLLPIGIAIMAIMYAPKILKKMLKTGAGG